MKKLFIIWLLALTSTSTYAQEPTKQETIDWIANKLVNSKEKTYYLQSDWQIAHYSFTSVSQASKGRVVYSTDDGVYVLRKMKESFTKRAILTIDLSNVHSVEVIETEGIRSLKILGSNIWNLKSYGIDEGVVRNTFIENTASQLILNIPIFKGTDPQNYIEQILIDFNAEPDLFNRMYKAFQTLVKINNAEKPKEKF